MLEQVRVGDNYLAEQRLGTISSPFEADSFDAVRSAIRPSRSRLGGSVCRLETSVELTSVVHCR